MPLPYQQRLDFLLGFAKSVRENPEVNGFRVYPEDADMPKELLLLNGRLALSQIARPSNTLLAVDVLPSLGGREQIDTVLLHRVKLNNTSATPDEFWPVSVTSSFATLALRDYQPFAFKTEFSSVRPRNDRTTERPLRDTLLSIASPFEDNPTSRNIVLDGWSEASLGDLKIYSELVNRARMLGSAALLEAKN